MSNKLNKNIKSESVGTVDERIMPIICVVGTKFNELISDVAYNKKSGTLTLKITVNSSVAGTVEIDANVRIDKCG